MNLAAFEWDDYESDKDIPGMLPPDAEPPASHVADCEREYAEGKAYSYETFQQYVARTWMDERQELNELCRRVYRARQAAERAFLKLSPRHARLVLDGGVDETAAAIVALKAWTGTLAVLAGKPGTGKSTAAAWWSWHRAQWDPSRLPRWITAAAFARSSRYDESRDELLQARALVIDDLGVEYADRGGSFRTDLDELVNAFYVDKRPLVITTNLDARTFERRYGERVVDRIAECGVWIPVLGESRRRAGS